ncbi:MAG: DUF4174 domain-containing protein [Pseudomonadota bacterium]
MKSRIILAVAALLAAVAPAAAADGAQTENGLPPVEAWQEDPSLRFDAADIDLADFLWLARPIVVFADTPADPRFREQMALLDARPEELIERDVVIITDTDPDARSAVRRQLRPRGFMMALLGKDGDVKLRKPFPWDVRELSRSIDKMPLRQQELRGAALATE